VAFNVKTIANKDLRLSDVPKDAKHWGEFALTFDGYEQHGGFAGCAAIANKRKPKTLTEFRTCLFFEQRRHRHFGTEPEREAMAYIKSLLEGIRDRVKQGQYD
jgi:hypothetical protein